MKDFLKLNYNEKKQVKLDDLNNQVMRECMSLIDEPDSTLTIIRAPLIAGLKYYFDKNAVQFRTKGATIDWDKQIDDTRNYINELDQNLM